MPDKKNSNYEKCIRTHCPPASTGHDFISCVIGASVPPIKIYNTRNNNLAETIIPAGVCYPPTALSPSSKKPFNSPASSGCNWLSKIPISLNSELWPENATYVKWAPIPFDSPYRASICSATCVANIKYPTSPELCLTSPATPSHCVFSSGPGMFGHDKGGNNILKNMYGDYCNNTCGLRPDLEKIPDKCRNIESSSPSCQEAFIKTNDWCLKCIQGISKDDLNNDDYSYKPDIAGYKTGSIKNFSIASQ